ncbi:hypothetical protein JCM10450v2_000558 [Rhodotorula kratochvilovae]
MNDSNPPQYSSAASGAPAVLVNLAPPADATSFQLGYLGHGPAFVAGEVQVKYAGPDDQPRPAFTRLEVCFNGVERAHLNPEDPPIDLFEQRAVLWGEGAAGSSSAGTSYASFPPSSTSFKLELTPDLPVCIHTTPSSSLAYTLTATLYSANSDTLPLVRCAPVHLVRTTPPGSLLAGSTVASLGGVPPSTTPRTVATTSPIAFSVRLPRTVFRRSEPIELMTRIEVPDAKAVGEGLRLRTVSAEFVRTIQVVGVSHSAPSSADGRDELEQGVSEPAEPQVHRTVLAHSGKSARFSPSRPIIIRLVLHPPTEPSCESITQSTILHTVSFAVNVIIGLVNVSPSSHAGSPCPDAVLSHDVFILPDTPTARTDKQKEVDREHTYAALPPPAEPWSAQQDAPVPTYVEHSEHDSGEPVPVPGASGSSTSAWALSGPSSSSGGLALAFDNVPYAAVYPTDGDEEEYDGYEELSLPATLSTRAPPPAIDEDVSPPSVGEPSSVAGLALAAARGGVIDEGELDLGEDEGETPPPDDFASYRSSAPASAGEPAPPPSFDTHTPAGEHAERRSDDLEPATPPPHIDFAPLPTPSTPPEHPQHHPSSPPPPLSPLGPAAADYLSRGRPPLSPLSPLPSPGTGERGLPPPYFTGALPPPPASPMLPRSRASSAEGPAEASHARGSSASSSDGSTASSTGAGAAREATAGEGEGDAEGDDPRPPPYEQREAHDRVELVRFGVNRRGELVL